MAAFAEQEPPSRVTCWEPGVSQSSTGLSVFVGIKSITDALSFVLIQEGFCDKR